MRAGADIVTGVQSHVPQAAEFLDGNLILYGLGNLYFDQMWREDTRQGLIAKHTIYEGRHLSTQLLPTILYDYGQPRWASPTEHAAILEKVFAAGQPAFRIGAHVTLTVGALSQRTSRNPAAGCRPYDFGYPFGKQV